MGKLNFPNQIKYTGFGYLDPKQGIILPNEEALKQFDGSEVFDGFSVMVLEDHTGLGPFEYWFNEQKTRWERKSDFTKLNVSVDADNKQIQLKFGEITLSSIELDDILGDRFIQTAEVTKVNDKGVDGFFIKLTYGNEATSKVEYLDLSELLENKAKIDLQSLEYSKESGGEEILGVKVKAYNEATDAAHITKSDDGLGISIPITGDDVGNEIN